MVKKIALQMFQNLQYDVSNLDMHCVLNVFGTV